METHAAIDANAEPAIRALCDTWLEELDAAASARPRSEVELLALALAHEVDELAPERALLYARHRGDISPTPEDTTV